MIPTDESAQKKCELEIGLVWFGFMAYQPLLVIQCQILFLHIY